MRILIEVEHLNSITSTCSHVYSAYAHTLMCTMHAYLLTYPRASTLGQRRCDLSHDLPANVTHNCMGPLFDRSWRSDGQGRGERGLQAAYCFLKDGRKTSRTESGLLVALMMEITTMKKSRRFHDTRK